MQVIRDHHTSKGGRLTKIAGGLLLVLILVWLGLGADGEAIRRWKEEAGPLPFFLAMTLLPCLGFPVTPFYILAGATFGVRLGLGGSLLAIAANLALSYWLAAHAMRPTLLALMRKLGREVPELDRRQAVRFTWLVKLAPGLPAFLRNYLLGVSRVPFGIYFSISLFVSFSYAAVLVVLGESVLEREASPEAIAILVLATLVAALLWWQRKRHHRSKTPEE